MTQKKSQPDDQPDIQPVPAEDVLPQTEETIIASDETPPISSEEPAVAVRRAYGYWLLTLFVVFTGSLASVSWYGWKLFQTNAARMDGLMATQHSDQLALSQSLKNTQGKLTQLSARLTTQEKKTGEQLAETQSETQHTAQALGGRLTALEKNLSGIQNRLGQGERAWKAAEIGFLLTRAQERLSIAQDPAGAAVALKLADQRLAALALPQTLPVRAAISDVLIGLHKADDFDAVGMALRLRRAAEGVSQWPLVGTPAKSATPASTSQAPAANTADTTATETAPWYVRWPRAAWHPVSEWFGRQFTLTRSDEPVKASARVSNDRETRLWLTAVREGLLSHDMRLMMPSIVEAQDWITQHYASDSTDVSHTLDALKETQDFYAGREWPSFTPIFKAWTAAGIENAESSSTHTPEVQP
jgi:uroporphyrin-III C-methyltransferase